MLVAGAAKQVWAPALGHLHEPLSQTDSMHWQQ